MIREGKTHQLSTLMQTSRKQGMITMDEAILQLYQDGLIDREDALQYAQDMDLMSRKIQPGSM